MIQQTNPQTSKSVKKEILGATGRKTKDPLTPSTKNAKKQSLNNSSKPTPNDSNNYKRIATGIPGFDDMIENGLKKGRITLLGGVAGAGKTIFGMQYIINGIEKYNQPGLYVSFEEDKQQVYDDMKRFGWDLKKLEKEGKFTFLQVRPKDIEKIGKKQGCPIRSATKKLGASRLVVDSISTYKQLHLHQTERKKASIRLFTMMREIGCTTLAIGQYHKKDNPLSPTIEFEVDSVIRLHNEKRENVRVRSVEVAKMRGTKHSKETFPLEITDQGIQVYFGENLFCRCPI